MNFQELRNPLTDVTNDVTITSTLNESKKRPREENEHQENPLSQNQNGGLKDANYDVETMPAECCTGNVRTRQRRRRPGINGAIFNLKAGYSRPRIHQIYNYTGLHALESFVSSNKADLISCHSMDSQSYLVPPYACAYSNASKQGKQCVLAVATEEGTVDILNTSKRNDWDPEPNRTTLQVHTNGIFDVKWSPSDSLIATASGDKNICITDPRSSSASALHTLHSVHTSTVKTIAWHPSNDNLLVSGGRDGRICLWDLRTKYSISENNDSRAPALMVIPYAHEVAPGKPTKHGRTTLVQRSVTSVVYVPQDSNQIISSGSGDGILRKWDLRYLKLTPKRGKKSSHALPVDESSEDFTTMSSKLPSADLLFSPRRARGIISLAIGNGPSAGRVFALGNDSRIHTYNTSGAGSIPLGIPQPDIIYSHRHMHTNSFYVRTAVSPCGRWLAAGGSSGSAFLFDATVSAEDRSPGKAIELSGQKGEVGAIDWADGMLASCADDGTVRIWRPDAKRLQQCKEDEEEAKWDWCWGRP